MLRRVLWFVLALWLIVGGGVLAIALSGGIGGLRAVVHKDGRVAGSMRTLLLVLGVCLALAVTIAVAVANGQDKARVGPAGITLTRNEADGRLLFARTCAFCHTLAADAAVGHIGPNLDVLLPNAALVEYAIQHGFARGNGQMPAGIYSGQQATDVAQFVAAVAGRN
jgi:hypothetical protein